MGLSILISAKPIKELEHKEHKPKRCTIILLDLTKEGTFNCRSTLFDLTKERYTPGGATQSGKGYQLRSDLSGAVAVVSRDDYKKRGCPDMISPQRGAVIVLIVNIADQITLVFVLIINKLSKVYFSTIKQRH